MPPELVKQCPATEERKYPYYKKYFNVRGFCRHEPACHVYHEKQQQPVPVANTDDTDPEMSENGMPLVHLGH